uniref:Uncharacterized protein n=1 Tax=Anguilla anguilla TaxID=7936 RepID=A0A0E9TIV6_ANGAN
MVKSGLPEQRGQSEETQRHRTPQVNNTSKVKEERIESECQQRKMCEEGLETDKVSYVPRIRAV